MKVLITGGCGFLGSNLASMYLSRGAEVCIVDSLTRKGSESNLLWLSEQASSKQLHFYKVDVANKHDLYGVFGKHVKVDFVCHVAGQVAMTTSLVDPQRDLSTNIVGTFNVLEAVRAFSPEALVAFSSTNKVYGDLEWIQVKETNTRYTLPEYPDGLDEHIPLDFSTPYGCSKGSADQYVRDWARVYGLKTVVFRHSSIYGGRQYSSIDQGWIGWFCLQALKQKSCHIQSKPPVPFTISGTGKQVRDVLHSKDLVQLYSNAYEHKQLLNGEIFNIGGGVNNSLSLLELFDILADQLSIPSLEYTRIPRRASDQDYFVASITKAKKILNWAPSVGAHQGIKDMIDWCKIL